MVGVSEIINEDGSYSPYILYQCSQCKKGMREFVEIIGDKPPRK
jgi:hypothetical protein